MMTLLFVKMEIRVAMLKEDYSLLDL